MNELKGREMKNERKGEGGTKPPHLMMSHRPPLGAGAQHGAGKIDPAVPFLAAVLLGSSIAVLENR